MLDKNWLLVEHRCKSKIWQRNVSDWNDISFKVVHCKIGITLPIGFTRIVCIYHIKTYDSIHLAVFKGSWPRAIILWWSTLNLCEKQYEQNTENFNHPLYKTLQDAISHRSGRMINPSPPQTGLNQVLWHKPWERIFNENYVRWHLWFNWIFYFVTRAAMWSK